MRAALALPLLLLAACAQVRPAAVDDYARVNHWAAERAEVTLRFHEGRAPVRARDLHLAPDTSWFLNPQRGTVERVATSGLARVELRARRAGTARPRRGRRGRPRPRRADGASRQQQQRRLVDRHQARRGGSARRGGQPRSATSSGSARARWRASCCGEARPKGQRPRDKGGGVMVELLRDARRSVYLRANERSRGSGWRPCPERTQLEVCTAEREPQACEAEGVANLRFRMETNSPRPRTNSPLSIPRRFFAPARVCGAGFGV